MERQADTNNQQRITIMLEIIPEDGQDADPAMVSQVGRGVMDMLRDDNYAAQSIPTGQRGGLEILFEVITFIENVGSDIWAHRDILDTLSALCAIFGAISPVAIHLLNMHGKQSTKNNLHDSPIKITVKIDDAEVIVETSDLETKEQVVKLAERFIANYPTIASKVTPRSNIKIQRSIPKRRTRQR